MALSHVPGKVKAGSHSSETDPRALAARALAPQSGKWGPGLSRDSSTSAPTASLPSMHQKHCFPAPSLPDPGLLLAASHTPGTGWAQSIHTRTRGNTHPCKEAPRCAEVGTTSPASKCLHPVRAAPQSSGLYSTKSTWKAWLQSPHFCPLHGVQGVPQTPSLLPESSWPKGKTLPLLQGHTTAPMPRSVAIGTNGPELLGGRGS